MLSGNVSKRLVIWVFCFSFSPQIVQKYFFFKKKLDCFSNNKHAHWQMRIYKNDECSGAGFDFCIVQMLIY